MEYHKAFAIGLHHCQTRAAILPSLKKPKQKYWTVPVNWNARANKFQVRKL